MRIIITCKRFDKDGRFILQDTLTTTASTFDKIAINHAVTEFYQALSDWSFLVYETNNENLSLYDCKIITR
jgi:hypothetical protein